MKRFLILLTIAFTSYSQHVPIIFMSYGQYRELIVDTVAARINATLNELKNNRTDEAIRLAAETDVIFGTFNYDIYRDLYTYMSSFMDRELNNNVINCYFNKIKRDLRDKYNYKDDIDVSCFLVMPNPVIYSVIFKDDSCKEAWCNLQEDFLEKYEFYRNKQKQLTNVEYR